MATTIRLTRMGKKKRPFYRLVAVDSRNRRDGAYLANLGYYNPFVDPPEVQLDEDGIVQWLGRGASVSDTARSLLRREGVLMRFSLQRSGLAAEEVERRLQDWRQKHAQELEANVERRQRERRQRAADRAEAERAALAAEVEQKAAEAAAAGEPDAATGTPEGASGGETAPEPQEG